MKVALLGAGKTGGQVQKLLEAGSDTVTVFRSSNPPTLDALRGHDVVIAFLPDPAFVNSIDLLVESGIPVVSGSTGFTWPEDIDARLQKQGVAWITASNFSLGMGLIYGMIKVMSNAPKVLDDYEFKLHEVHHIHKKDQPSGTSLSWQAWLGEDVAITSARDGDNPGDHKLTLVTPYEDIIVQHQAKDRRIFAQGAIWAAQKLTSERFEPGLHNFQDILQKELTA